MTMSEWETHEFETRVREILQNVAADDAETNPGHHLGIPFVTAYQLAIEFNQRHPHVAVKLGLQVGGKGIGERTSLAQYMARELSQRVKRGELPGIRGAFLSRLHVETLKFIPEVESSTVNLSMFRLDDGR